MTPPDLLNPTVFVVDDDQQMRDSLCALLEVLGFQVMAFATPGSFHRFYRREMPGCLLLDIRMPRQTGLELYERLLRGGQTAARDFHHRPRRRDDRRGRDEDRRDRVPRKTV